MLLNCGAREDSWETLDSKEIKPVNLEGNQPWILIGRIDAEAEAPILPPAANNSLTGKKPWCWERLKAEGEEGDRGCDGWMASPIQWTWTWAKSGRWWGTGKPSVLQSVGLQRVRHELATEKQDFQPQWRFSCEGTKWRLNVPISRCHSSLVLQMRSID